MERAEQGNEEDLCAICNVATRGELEAAGGLGVLSCCDHWYCADCILPWLMRRSSTCPTCRQQVDWMAVHDNGHEVSCPLPPPCLLLLPSSFLLARGTPWCNVLLLRVMIFVARVVPKHTVRLSWGRRALRINNCAPHDTGSLACGQSFIHSA